MLIRSIRNSVSRFFNNGIVIGILGILLSGGLIFGIICLDEHLKTLRNQVKSKIEDAAEVEKDKKIGAELKVEIDAREYDNVKRWQEWMPECHKSEFNKLIDSCLVDNIISHQEYDIISKKHSNLHDFYMLSEKQKRIAAAKQDIRSAFDK